MENSPILKGRDMKLNTSIINKFIQLEYKYTKIREYNLLLNPKDQDKFEEMKIIY
jgi:hypothetical protein